MWGSDCSSWPNQRRPHMIIRYRLAMWADSLGKTLQLKYFSDSTKKFHRINRKAGDRRSGRQISQRHRSTQAMVQSSAASSVLAGTRDAVASFAHAPALLGKARGRSDAPRREIGRAFVELKEHLCPHVQTAPSDCFVVRASRNRVLTWTRRERNEIAYAGRLSVMP
jgi:hypothetical protein